MDALGSDLSIRLSRREEIPAPSPAKRGQRPVSVPLWLAPKLALFLAMRDQRVSNSELARRLGLRERIIRRMLDPGHATKAVPYRRILEQPSEQAAMEKGNLIRREREISQGSPWGSVRPRGEID